MQKKPLDVPPKWEAALSSLKYIVAGTVLYLTWKTGELVFRAVDPCYALLSRHGEDITIVAYIISGILLVGSMFISLPFCRWLCPLAAILNPLAAVSRFRIRRDKESCIDCGKCAKACPMSIPVDKNDNIIVAKCLACKECIDVCPKNSGTPKTLRSTLSRGTVVVVLLGCLVFSVSVYAMFPLASFTKVRGARTQTVESTMLKIDNLTCRGTANRLWFYLERDDLYALPGYLLVEVWPDPTVGTIRVTFDPSQVSRDDICRAITEPYVNFAVADSAGQIMHSPFVVHGYDPLDILD